MRRCEWCLRPLRWWQSAYCRVCSRDLGAPFAPSTNSANSKRDARADGLFRIGDKR